MIIHTLRAIGASLFLVLARYMLPLVQQEGTQAFPALVLGALALGAFTSIACIILLGFPE